MPTTPFSALTLGLVIWPVKIVPEMTYNVSNGKLNPTHSLTQCVSRTQTEFVFFWKLSGLYSPVLSLQMADLYNRATAQAQRSVQMRASAVVD